MNKIPFTTQQRTAIGEFMFAIETDTMIKSEADGAILSLFDNGLITLLEHNNLSPAISLNFDGISEKIKEVLMTKISQEQGCQIMNEYKGGSYYGE